MAGIDVTITGILYNKVNRTSEPVVLFGEASLTGLGVGGGPIESPPGSGSGEPTPPDRPRPTPPVPGWPSVPGWTPGAPGGPGIPKPPTEPPPDPITPPIQWRPLWTQEHGWVAVGIIDPDIPHPTPSAAPAPAPAAPVKK